MEKDGQQVTAKSNATHAGEKKTKKVQVPQTFARRACLFVTNC